jgi:hypothetical protein
VFDVKRPRGRRAAQIKIGSFTTTLHYSSDGGDLQIGSSRPVDRFLATLRFVAESAGASSSPWPVRTMGQRLDIEDGRRKRAAVQITAM